ncbi:DNA/RNA non-specific endonuclease [bacterium]|nr:DNA/RNA non-specific endonuclease [bacterium]
MQAAPIAWLAARATAEYADPASEVLRVRVAGLPPQEAAAVANAVAAATLDEYHAHNRTTQSLRRKDVENARDEVRQKLGKRRAAVAESARATFVMTNMIPRAPHLNQQGWADMEDYCRAMVRRRPTALYIVAGPTGQGGEGSKGQADTVGNGKVVVPAKCWKVVLAVENGTGSADDLGRVNSASRVFAVVMPNDQSVGHGWARFRTSVDEVEGLTGYKFFDRVPPDIIGPLKSRVDSEAVRP